MVDGAKPQMGSTSTQGGEGCGGGGGNRDRNIDQKEMAVWKLPRDIAKMTLGHWLDAVDMQLVDMDSSTQALL